AAGGASLAELAVAAGARRRAGEHSADTLGGRVELGDHAGQLGPVDEHGWLRVLEQVADLGGRQPRVERGEDGTDTTGREEDLPRRDVVRPEIGDAVSAHHPEPGERQG